MHHTGTGLIDPNEVLERVGIRQGWQVVDLGCGSLGHFTIPAARLVGGLGKVYAVDIQKPALQAVERAARYEQLWNVHPVWSDIERINAAHIPSDAADLTLIANTLHQVQHQAGLWQEAVRLTRPGGLILILEWKNQPTVLGPALENRLSLEDIQSYGIALELLVNEVFEAGDHHDAVLFQKLESDEPRVLSTSNPFTV
ncbi:MAG: class I SAM-dependent methyltransferase [Candidatus Uhrbacteria bacterium]|nr:class I SAM-dependent methyltransferase [Candidatus Uhrbacteria bacterium]MDP3793266.1 class I SAM-dependent methyltransferase [Candidatus Uhrbacteria bacterium]